ncbi:hypothetical protein GALL_461510 [mine drainage metagenome]|uniref:Uncharacterized protein n=1 Tax=mine drainage metagenome TaxID=410659 RepID=A0A1J5PXD2_9ZZZZ
MKSPIVAPPPAFKPNWPKPVTTVVVKPCQLLTSHAKNPTKRTFRTSGARMFCVSSIAHRMAMSAMLITTSVPRTALTSPDMSPKPESICVVNRVIKISSAEVSAAAMSPSVTQLEFLGITKRAIFGFPIKRRTRVLAVPDVGIRTLLGRRDRRRATGSVLGGRRSTATSKTQ